MSLRTLRCRQGDIGSWFPLLTLSSAIRPIVLQLSSGGDAQQPSIIQKDHMAGDLSFCHGNLHQRLALGKLATSNGSFWLWRWHIMLCGRFDSFVGLEGCILSQALTALAEQICPTTASTLPIVIPHEPAWFFNK